MPGQTPLRLPAYWLAELQRPPNASSDWQVAWLAADRCRAAEGAGIPKGVWFVPGAGYSPEKF